MVGKCIDVLDELDGRLFIIERSKSIYMYPIVIENARILYHNIISMKSSFCPPFVTIQGYFFSCGDKNDVVVIVELHLATTKSLSE